MNTALFRACFMLVVLFVGHFSFAAEQGVQSKAQHVVTLECDLLYDYCAYETPNVPVGDSVLIHIDIKDTLLFRGNKQTDLGARDVRIRWEIGNVDLAFGSGSIWIVGNKCTGTVIYPLEGDSCRISVLFYAAGIGYHRDRVIVNFQKCEEYTASGADVCFGDREAPIPITGRSVEQPPKCKSTKKGSVIDIDGQSVIEQIPIVGTEFFLSYSSANSPDYISQYNNLGIRDVFNPHLWTFSGQHFFDTVQRRVYLGDGSILKVEAADLPDGNFLVVSADGKEIYIFGPDGRHLETKFGLTDSTKYTFTYSLGNRLVKVEDAFGNEIHFNRDGNDNLVSIKAPYSQTTVITLNGNNYISVIENPNGETYELTYKPGTSLLSSFKKPAGQTTYFTYDGSGRLIKEEGSG